MKIRELINKVNQITDDNTNIVFLLLEKHSSFDRDKIFSHLEDEIDFDINEFNKDVEEYIAGKPIQHIVGYEYFYGRKINCNNGAFIPRYETEQLCEEVIMYCDEHFTGKKVCVDVGTGSGAIALTLNLELGYKTYATEISEDAVVVAKENIAQNKAEVEIIQGNMLDPLIDNNIKVDLLVSNPPYIKDGDFLPKSVIEHDPQPALWGGKDGLDFYREIIDKCDAVLNKDAVIAFEFGWDQKEELEAIIKKKFKTYEFLKDHSDKWRIVIIQS